MNSTSVYTPIGAEVAPEAFAEEDHRNRNILLAGLGILAFLALLAGGLMMRSTPAASTSVQSSSVVSKSAAQSPPAAQRPAVADDAAVASVTVDPPAAPVTTAAPAPKAAPPAAPAPKPAPPAPAPAAPKAVIKSFVTPENIDCHNGNSQTFTATWTTTNAVKVTISVDGPGIYNTYSANGTADLPFACSTPHTYLLTAFGQDGKTVTKLITLQPRNVPKPVPADDGI